MNTPTRPRKSSKGPGTTPKNSVASAPTPITLLVMKLGRVTAAPSPTPSTGDSTEVEIDAAWLDDGRIIGLVTTGSSTCVPAADEATLQADGSLAVTLVEPDADTACTRDLVPRVTLVEVPEGVDPSKALAITVTGDGYSGRTDLDGADGLTGGGMTDYLNQQMALAIRGDAPAKDTLDKIVKYANDNRIDS